MAQLTPRRDPNKVIVGGPQFDEDEDVAVALEEIFWGATIEKVLDSGVLKWQNTSSAVNVPQRFLAREFSEANVQQATNISGSYAIGETVLATGFATHTRFWARLVSGQDIIEGETLQVAGDGSGNLIVASSDLASAGVALFISKESTGGATAAITRLLVECIA